MRESLLTVQVRVLEMLVQGKPLETVLSVCLELCEAHTPDMLCSIFLLDADGIHLRHGAAPSLPGGYMKAIDGSLIGATAGFCGTAAFKGEAVMVEDIATDPLWTVHKDLAMSYGLRSCLSAPIFDADRKVLGTFAMYYRKPGRPEADHRTLIEMITHVAGIAIACRRAEEEKQRSFERTSESEKMIAIGQLAGGIAHDFNNQLAIMLGYAGLLESRLPDPEMKRFASAIVRAANRSGDLTRNLLSFSRQGHMENVPIDVHELIVEMIDLLGHSFDRRISIQRRFNTGYAYVLGDPSCLQNALLNLVLNARDAMPDGGTLEFATDSIDLPGAASKEEKATKHNEELADLAPGAYLRVRVTDTGTGMTEDVRKRIFEPFFTTKPIGKGTGMGMASAFGAMRSHKGRILVDSAPGQGTTLHLYLPLTAMGQAKSAPRSSPAPDRSSQSMRVLIVDDEIPVRNLIADMLKAGGHTIIGAADGRESLRIFKQRWREIDLVLLDMVMPDIDGYDTFQELRRIHPGAKVIVSSGYTADGKIEALIGQGAKGLLQKPYGKAQLEKAMEGAMV